LSSRAPAAEPSLVVDHMAALKHSLAQEGSEATNKPKRKTAGDPALEAGGFSRMTAPADRKQNRPRQWRLTMRPAAGKSATKEFMRRIIRMPEIETRRVERAPDYFRVSLISW
jgi:hypothetical protein